MVKLIFEFDKAEIAKAGLTEDELLAEVREYAKKNKISETSFGVFEKDGEDALCLLMMIAHNILCDRPHYLDCLKSLMLDDEGEIEDCVEIAKEWSDKE
ncbi:MAG: hypothetical protein PUG48_05320 [Clostridia bacterium]|nr:hypothetical protein [Clostridia bacterium]